MLTASHADYVRERRALPWHDRRERFSSLHERDLCTVAFRAGAVWMTECCRSVAVWLAEDAYADLESDRHNDAG